MTYEHAFIIGAAGALIALVFAYLQSRKVLKFSEGTPAMTKIANAIRRGAGAYLKRQFRVVAIFYVIVVAALAVLAAMGHASRFIPFAFLTGGIFSQLSAYIGMKIATKANVRTANASSESLNQGLKVAFASGTVLSFTVVGLSILDVSVWFLILRFGFGLGPAEIAENMVMFGVGVAVFALFARVGGGIFTKAADVGADLVGKVEAGIPEDDPRNPAVIADNVGDNVGDVAGMGADLYESYIKSMHAGLALGFAAFQNSDMVWAAMFLPVAIAVVGMIASLIGTFLIRTGEKATQSQLLRTLRTGTFTAAGLAMIASAPLAFFIMDGFVGRWGLFVSIVIGVLAGCLIAYFTEYFTSTHYKPTRELAKASETGSATIVIGGISLGMKSTVAPVLIVVVAIVGSFLASGGVMGDFYIFDVGPGASAFSHGLYGIGLAAVGMLSTLGITLATDAYGPVADNAGGIAEMAHLPAEVRERTDALDALGNTTAATGKGFAIGSAALTSLALLVSYINIATDHVARHGGYVAQYIEGVATGYMVHRETGSVFAGLDLSLDNPNVLIGIFLGAMLVFVFSALTMSAVQRAAQSIVMEVRRQFREIVGIMEEKVDPDYAACVDLCTRGALKEMVLPTVISVILPIVTGLIFGIEGVVGFIGGATVIGFVVAVFMCNAGGAWDNAKKYIESGELGGKGSDCHKAAVIGDTVGDPFKDTTGPSINTLFKLVATVSITVVSVIAAFSVF